MRTVLDVIAAVLAVVIVVVVWTQIVIPWLTELAAR